MNHVYRTYENLGVTVCQNCAKLKKNIELSDQEEICNPPQMELIKPMNFNEVEI